MDDKLGNGPESGRGTGGSNSGRLLTSLIGPSVKIRGSVKDGKNVLTIRGSVEGSIEHEETLLLDEQSSITADVKAAEVVVRGDVIGDIQGRDRVKLEFGGNVVGDIFTRRFAVDDGAKMKGRVDMNLDPPAAATGAGEVAELNADGQTPEPPAEDDSTSGQVLQERN